MLYLTYFFPGVPLLQGQPRIHGSKRCWAVLSFSQVLPFRGLRSALQVQGPGVSICWVPRICYFKLGLAAVRGIRRRQGARRLPAKNRLRSQVLRLRAFLSRLPQDRVSYFSADISTKIRLY